MLRLTAHVDRSVRRVRGVGSERGTRDYGRAGQARTSRMAGRARASVREFSAVEAADRARANLARRASYRAREPTGACASTAIDRRAVRRSRLGSDRGSRGGRRSCRQGTRSRRRYPADFELPPEGISHGVHVLPGTEDVGIAERDVGKIGRADEQHGQVQRGVR